MSYFIMIARPLAPIYVQDNRQSNSSRSLKYFPGSSVRGAVAAHYLRRGGDPKNELFRRVFLDDPVSFPDLHPAGDSHACSRPLPSTACSCKRVPGLKTQEGHGIGDILARICIAVSGFDHDLGEYCCPICGHEMKPRPGVWNGKVHAPRQFDVTLQYNRHTGINRRTGTAATSIYYVTQGIAYAGKTDLAKSGQNIFSGGLHLTDDQFAALRELLNGTVFVGADRTRGMGEVELTLNKVEPPAFDLLEWNEAMRKKIGKPIDGWSPEGLLFSITLDSHAILIDPFLRPTAALSIEFEGVVEIARIAHSQIVRGWHDSWRLPKTEDMAVARGSVYLFRYVGDEVESLKSHLKELSVRGVGLRKVEGNGRITVCDPFHVQQEEL